MALLLGTVTALGAGPLEGQGAGASTVPVVTAVLLPWNGDVVHGSQVLDALAWSGFRDHVTSVEFVLTGGSYKKSLIGTATPSIFGWVYFWNTADVPNGTYALRSMATDAAGNSTYSPKVTISVSNPLTVVPLISQFPTVTVGDVYISGPEPSCTGNADVADFAQVLGGSPPYRTSFSTSPTILFTARYTPVVFGFGLPGDDLSFEPEPDVGSVYVGGTPENEPVENSTFTLTVSDATGASASLSFPWTILNPDGLSCSDAF